MAALYQQGRVHHIGTFPQLEDQMTNFTSDIDRAAAGHSPDRVDALVWAFSELLVEPMKSEGIYELYRRYAEAAEQRDKSQPTKTVYAPGSMEWFEAQKKKAEPSSGIVLRAPPIPRNARNAAEIRGFCAAVLEVRIHLPPAESLRTFGS